MSSCEGVVCLPTLVWYHITRYLSPRDLVSLSATCRQIRYFLNENSVWKSHVRAPAASEALGALQSVVTPVFTELSSDTEETPCESKVDLLRENRLLSNLRKGKCVQYSYEFEKRNVCRRNHPIAPVDWQITYKSIYLFIVELTDDDNVVLHVYNIESSPRLVSSFPVMIHIDPLVCHRWRQYWIHVVGNKLIIMSEYRWLDIYEIHFPSVLFPHLHTIEFNKYDQFTPLVCDHVVFCLSDDETEINVWNLDNGEFIKAIKSDIENARMSFIYPSLISNYVLIEIRSPSLPSYLHVVSYDAKSMQFTPTKLDVNEFLPYRLAGGLADAVHVVLFIKHDLESFLILVYDCKSSCLIQNKIINCANYFVENRSTIINNCLVLPSFNDVKILNLPDLETVWDINVNLEMDRLCKLREIYYFRIPGLYNLIVIQKKGMKGEVWDFESRRKIFDCLDWADNIVLTESGSKIILETFYKTRRKWLKTINFW